jgi:hypothetical protein
VPHYKERTHRRDVYALHCSSMESSGVWRWQHCVYWARSDVIMVVSINNVTVFWEVMPSNLHTQMPACWTVEHNIPENCQVGTGILWRGNNTSYALLRIHVCNTWKFSLQLLIIYKQLFLSVFCFTVELLVIIGRFLWFSLLVIWNLKTVFLIFILLPVNQHFNTKWTHTVSLRNIWRRHWIFIILVPNILETDVCIHTDLEYCDSIDHVYIRYNFIILWVI